MSDEEDDPVACGKCNKEDASSENPIIKCDGDHPVEVGYHLSCTDLESLPDGDWFCPACTAANVWAVESLLDKKTMKGKCTAARVHYRVRWKGYDSDADTWEPLANLPKAMVAAYKKRI